MYQAYRQGRIKNDPTPNWYEGEIRFFDGYVIPLAQKLGDCGMLGASGDEYLSTYMRWRGPPFCPTKILTLRPSSSSILQLQNSLKPIVQSGRKKDKKSSKNGLTRCRMAQQKNTKSLTNGLPRCKTKTCRFERFQGLAGLLSRQRKIHMRLWIGLSGIVKECIIIYQLIVCQQ